MVLKKRMVLMLYVKVQKNMVMKLRILDNKITLMSVSAHCMVLDIVARIPVDKCLRNVWWIALKMWIPNIFSTALNWVYRHIQELDKLDAFPILFGNRRKRPYKVNIEFVQCFLPY